MPVACKEPYVLQNNSFTNILNACATPASMLDTRLGLVHAVQNHASSCESTSGPSSKNEAQNTHMLLELSGYN
eukprot:5389975-Pyramimonas_sp.AAC.1